MAKIRIKQIKSTIGKPFKQKLTMQALGLRKINHVREFESSPSLNGMINKVQHLLKIENI